MTSKIKLLTLFVFIVFSLTVTVKGVCQVPTNWKYIFGSTSTEQLWGLTPKSATSIDWDQYMFSDTIMTDLSSNTRYECQDSVLDASTGITKIFYKRLTDNTMLCFYGKLTRDDSTNKVLIYKRSVESTTNPPTSLAECDAQTGIDGDVFSIMVRAPFDTYTYNHMFTDLPDNTYLFAMKKGSAATGCENDPSSTLTKNNVDVTVISSCVSTANLDLYANPFSKSLKITDSIPAAGLGLTSSTTAGFVIFNTVKTEGGKTYAYRFFIAKYEIVNGAFRLTYESKVPSLAPKGYWVEALIPSDHEPVTVTLQTTLCNTGTYCQNGGTCVPGFTTATCLCDANHEGEKCEKAVDRCTPNPCLNSGVCSQTVEKYTCQCTAQYAGINCEMDNKCLTTTCLNGGSCYTYRDAGNVDKAFCSCTTPYTGSLCDVIDPCLNVPCKNGGTCLSLDGADSSDDFKCKCPLGYYGDTCELLGNGPCDNDPCLNGGSCEVIDTSFVCRCVPGYSGNTCEVGQGCTANPCKNDGKCSDVGDSFYCECTSYYTGPYCAEYEDWFIILLVLIILTAIIFFILVTVCACYFCCGWKPGSNKTPYEAYTDQQMNATSYGGDQLAYMPAYGPPADPVPDTVQFNFVPMSPYQGIAPAQESIAYGPY